jgi:hypothetical protein
MLGHQLLLTPSGTTPNAKPRVSHCHKHTCWANICDGPTEKQEETKKKKRQRTITPSPSSPTTRVDASDEVTHLVITVSQLPLDSTTTVDSPHRSSRLNARAPIFNVAAAFKQKQKVLGFKLNYKTIYVWFREDLEPSSLTSLSLLKKKAQNNLDMSNTRTAKFRQKMARVRELQQI